MLGYLQGSTIILKVAKDSFHAFIFFCTDIRPTTPIDIFWK